MTLVDFIIVLIVGGLCWYLVDAYMPLPRPVKLVLRAVCIIALCFLLLALFGVVQMPFRLV